MKLPNVDEAVVPQAKVLQYLLDENHPQGTYKAAFFRSLGFTPGAWQVLKTALLRHGREHVVLRTEGSPFGTRYVIEGTIEAPNGGQYLVRTIWFIDNGDDKPRLVTAYPP